MNSSKWLKCKCKQTCKPSQSLSEEVLKSQNRPKMKDTTSSTNLSVCGFSSFPLNPAKISRDVRAVFTVRITVNALTCPLIVLLNILVMVSVKTKRPLRTKSNIALACLATTDLVVGVFLQPLHIAMESFLLKGEHSMFCTITDVSKTVTLKCLLASFHHLVLMSAERYFAIKHPFAYETKVTEFRIIMASALAWTTAIIIPSQSLLIATKLSKTILAVSEMVLLILTLYFNVSVYKEVRRSEKQIAANQVSLEAKKKILRNKKAFYTTVIITLVLLLSHIPLNICLAILFSFKSRISPNLRLIVLYIFTLLPVLNSLFNPLIYAVRVRNFRVAFIQILSRKTAAQAEEVERKIFGPRQIGVNSNISEGQGNQTLNDEHEAARQA